MQPQIYNLYLQALSGQTTLTKDQLNSSAQNYMSFTVKNYNQGMSQKIHAYGNEPTFQIIGPIGKSLGH